MEANNGNEVDENLSPLPLNEERIAILDAGAQYGKVRRNIINMCVVKETY